MVDIVLGDSKTRNYNYVPNDSLEHLILIGQLLHSASKYISIMTTKLYNCFIIVLFYSQAALSCFSHIKIFYLTFFLVDTRPFCFVSGS